MGKGKKEEKLWMTGILLLSIVLWGINLSLDIWGERPTWPSAIGDAIGLGLTVWLMLTYWHKPKVKSE